MAAFQPLVGKTPSILILGSMPSQRSLAEERYYAHPQNSFWWIMSRLIGFGENLSYRQKCEYLKASNFALWDVLFDCKRQGSLDGSIERSSERVNDFAEFFSKLSSIELIGFNGLAAKQIFMRHCSFLFNDFPRLRWCQLPSTSSAYASLGRQDKLKAWQTALIEDFDEKRSV